MQILKENRNLDAGRAIAPTGATMVARAECAVNVKSHSSIHRLGYARTGTDRTFVLLAGSPSWSQVRVRALANCSVKPPEYRRCDGWRAHADFFDTNGSAGVTSRLSRCA
jgi:hypothetical protein